MRHVALLGDSIFDNAAYTRGEPDVVTHLRAMLPDGWRATLLARDGAVTAEVASQLARVPVEATHLVVSVGGNDALMSADLLGLPVRSTAQALSLFGDRAESFERGYRRMVDAVLRRPLATALCTIYNGMLEPERAAIARTALTLFNDVILRAGIAHALPMIDLRLVCCEPAHYANPIEPSGEGGRRIASSILRFLQLSDRLPNAAVILGGDEELAGC